MSRGDVLRAHYLQLLKKIALWSGLVALMASMVPYQATAATQMLARKVTVSSAVASATGVTYDVTFRPGTSTGIGSLKFQLCTSPLEGSCTAPDNATLASANFSAAGPTTAPFTSNWAEGSGGTATTQTAFYLVRSSGTDALSNATDYTYRITAVTNPDQPNKTYYARLTTYTGTDGSTGETDFGGFALSTNQSMNISATVQEQLRFCVGETVSTGDNCATIGDGTVSLATGSGCPVLSIANVCTGTSQMAASTNANAGYSITYNGSTFAGPSDTITAVGNGGGAGGATSSPGSKQFGMAITSTAGSGTGAATNAYDFSGSLYSYVASTPAEVIASASAATVENVFTVTYAANVSNTTKPGLYQANIEYICTGTF